MNLSADAVIIGLGIGGQTVAQRLRAAGLTVIGIERSLIGGECHNWACVPTKMMIRAGNALAEAGRVPALAGTASVTADWKPVAARISGEATDGWDDASSYRELTDAGIRVLRGHATFAGPGRVRVGDDVVTAGRAVVIATGTEPSTSDIDGLAGTPYWTNRDVAELTEAPSAVIILGGGPVGCEFAQVLHRFGTAVGDVTGRGPFTRVATYQARIAAADIIGQPHPPADYRAVPRCVFIDPEFAAVGVTVAEAAEQGIRLKIGHAGIPKSARGFIHHIGNTGFITLYADADRDVLVGAVAAGPAGGEIIGLLTVAVQAAVPLDTLRYMIYAYPTFYRAIEDALTDMDGGSDRP